MNMHSSLQLTGDLSDLRIWIAATGTTFVTIEQGYTSLTIEPRHIRDLAAALDAHEAEQAKSVSAGSLTPSPVARGCCGATSSLNFPRRLLSSQAAGGFSPTPTRKKRPMKNFLLATALLTAPAYADGLASVGLADPEVIAPSRNSGDWTSFYAGISYGRTKATSTITTTREEVIKGYDYHEATCTRTEGHEGSKCRLDQTMWDALNFGPTVNPWDKAPFKLNDGALTDQLAKYDAGYKGLWMGDDADGSHTWNIGQHIPDVAALNAPTGQDAVLSVAHQFKADEINLISETATLAQSMTDAGAFAGYRHDFGRIVAGVEIGAIGDLVTLEAQAGFDLGRALPYAFAGAGQFDGQDGTVYGAGVDLRVGKRLLVGIKHTIGEFGATDTSTTALRVGFRF